MSRDQWLDGLEPGDAVLIVYPGMYSPIKPTAGELRATVGTVDVEKIYLRWNPRLSSTPPVPDRLLR
jgi:hypothetical protein